MRNRVLLLCVLLCSVGCSKENELTYPCTFVDGVKTPLDKVRVYTEGGREITGAEAEAFIRRFDSEGGDPVMPELPDSPKRPPFSGDQFFEGPNGFPNSVTMESHKLLSVGESNAKFLRAGTTAGFFVCFPYFGQSEYSYRIGWFKPPQGTYQYWMFACNADKARMPVLCFMYTYTYTNEWGTSHDEGCEVKYNELDPAFLPSLTKYDTVAIRKFVIRYRRQ